MKTVIAAVLVLLWVPVTSCCLLDASGLLEKGDCCSKEHSHPASGPGGCEKPCGVLASATYLSQQDQFIVAAPVGDMAFAFASRLVEPRLSHAAGRDLPATAPPELAGCWQFSFRTALPPRAPSFAS